MDSWASAVERTKIYPDPLSAVADIFDGAVIMLGGFGAPGRAQNLIKALMEQGAKDLTCICNTCALPTPGQYDVVNLVERGQVKKLITTFPGNPNQRVPAVDLWRRGKLEIDVVPQGILAERMRAAAAGLGGVFVPSAPGTSFDEGYEKRAFDGRECILATPLKADFALLAAHKADSLGNLTYRLTQRNYNPTMAPAADVTIVEVRELVEVGQISPERVTTPSIYVDRLVVVGGVT
jgi:3-oxoadipate CoA-transferase alpha subunit